MEFFMPVELSGLRREVEAGLLDGGMDPLVAIADEVKG